MTTLYLQSAIWAALGTALLQLVWQAALVGLAVAAVQPWLQAKSAAGRYLVACAGMLAIPVLFVATLARAASGGNGSVWGAEVAAPSWLSAAAPYVALAWLLGLAGFATYVSAGWLLAQRLRRRAVAAVPEVWQTHLAELRWRMAVRARISLRVSSDATGPCVLGWWRPVVLLPASLLSGLTMEQCEAVLAHELAHVRRHDYLVNLVQRLVEVLFFYHPAVWWLSHRVSEERELCCDDAAVAACGNRAAYAGALVELAQRRLQGTNPQLAMAATGGGLRLRVARLLGHPAGRGRGRWGLVTGAAVLMSLTVVGLYLGSALGQAPLPLPPAASAPAPVAPARHISWRQPQPAIAAALPTLPPRSRVQLAPAQPQFVGFTMEEVQRCIPGLAMQRVMEPSGQVVLQVRTVTQCVPVVQPMEVWVMSSM